MGNTLKTALSFTQLEEIVQSRLTAPDPNYQEAITSIENTFEPLGKYAPSLAQLEERINSYSVSSQRAAKFQFAKERVPSVFRYLIEHIMPPENVDGWLQDREAFQGHSVLDKFSALHQGIFDSNVEEVYNAVSQMISFLSIPKPSLEQMKWYLRLSQAEQLGLK